MAETMDPTAKAPTSDEQLLSLMRHDLRSPLLNLSMVASLLARDEATADLGDLVAEAGQRLGRLTRDLLDFALVQLGTPLLLEKHAVDVGSLTRSVVAELAATLPNHAVVVDGEAHGTFDPDRMKQLLQNLIAGAVRYGKSKTPVRVTLRPGEIEVHVEGPAHPEERLASLFPGPGVLPDANAGLGLQLVRLIAEAHGGSAKVARAEGGTAFTVLLEE